MVSIPVLREWGPFKLDALGIVTLIGVQEVGAAFGRLATNRYTLFLPTLGSFVFADKSFTKPVPGFQAYNVDDSIYTSDIAGWFARWLLSQQLKNNATKIDVEFNATPSKLGVNLIAVILGITAHAPTVVLSVLIGDWWGLACSILTAASTLSRWVLIQQNKWALDENAGKGISWRDGCVGKKSFWILPTGEAVTIRAPKGLLVNCLLANPKTGGLVSFWARVVGWAAFGGFVVSLGMACLFIQVLLVVALLSGTLAVVFHLGDDDETIGTRMKIKCSSDDSDSDYRSEAYYRLGLTPEQEDVMINWSLFPKKANKVWWRSYEHCKHAGVHEFARWGEWLGEFAGEDKVPSPVASVEHV